MTTMYHILTNGTWQSQLVAGDIAAFAASAVGLQHAAHSHGILESARAAWATHHHFDIATCPAN